MLMNVDFIYPVGCLFITTDISFNPNIKFGGTWARLEGDVYLKNVPTNSGQPIGNYGGTSSQHKIPVSSMPSHGHNVATVYPFTAGGARTAVANSNSNNRTGTATDVVDATGGGQPYYPYYYGIICWHRTA